MAELNKLFLYGNKADLPATRNATTLYFVTDTRELYKGDDLYTEGVRFVDNLPAVANAATGVIYVEPNGKASVLYTTTTIVEEQPVTTTIWKELVKAYTTSSGSITDSSTDATVPTTKLVYDFVSGEISDLEENGTYFVRSLVQDTANGKIHIVNVIPTQVVIPEEGTIDDVEAITNTTLLLDSNKKFLAIGKSNLASGVTPAYYVPASGFTSISVAGKGTVNNPTYDAETRTITLPKTGEEDLVITLGKDIFLDPTAPNAYNTSTHQIELFLNDGNFVALGESATFDQDEYYFAKAVNYNTATVTAETFDSLKATLYTLSGGVYTLLDNEATYDGEATYYTRVVSDSKYANVDVTAETFSTLKSTLYTRTGSVIRLDAEDLIDIYTAKSTNSVNLTVSNNEFEANVKVSEVTGNTLEIKSDGLYVASTEDDLNSIVNALTWSTFTSNSNEEEENNETQEP